MVVVMSHYHANDHVYMKIRLIRLISLIAIRSKRVEEGYTYNRAMSTKKEKKLVRAKVTTTLDAELWQELQIQAVREKSYANDIMERLIAEYLKKVKEAK